MKRSKCPTKKILVGNKSYSSINKLKEFLHPCNTILRNGKYCKIVSPKGRVVELNLDETNYLVIESPEIVHKVPVVDYLHLPIPNVPKGIQPSFKVSSKWLLK